MSAHEASESTHCSFSFAEDIGTQVRLFRNFVEESLHEALGYLRDRQRRVSALHEYAAERLAAVLKSHHNPEDLSGDPVLIDQLLSITEKLELKVTSNTYFQCGDSCDTLRASCELNRGFTEQQVLLLQDLMEPVYARESWHLRMRRSGISLNDFFVLKEIGSGAYASVHLVRHKATKKLYALKKIRKERLSNLEDALRLRTERAVMMRIRSNFIVQLHYAFQDNDCLYFVMDLASGGDLKSLLDMVGGAPESWVRRWFAEILCSVLILHGHIQPENSVTAPLSELRQPSLDLSVDTQIPLRDISSDVDSIERFQCNSNGSRRSDGFIRRPGSASVLHSADELQPGNLSARQMMRKCIAAVPSKGPQETKNTALFPDSKALGTQFQDLLLPPLPNASRQLLDDLPIDKEISDSTEGSDLLETTSQLPSVNRSSDSHLSDVLLLVDDLKVDSEPNNGQKDLVPKLDLSLVPSSCVQRTRKASIIYSLLQSQHFGSREMNHQADSQNSQQTLDSARVLEGDVDGNKQAELLEPFSIPLPTARTQRQPILRELVNSTFCHPSADDMVKLDNKALPPRPLNTRVTDSICSEQAMELVQDCVPVHNIFIHRDLKPLNFLLKADGHLLLADFGLAEPVEVHGNESPRLSAFRETTGKDTSERDRVVIGTVEYMAPEIFNKDSYGRSIDYWSLGIILYEMLTGEAAFTAESNEALIERLTSIRTVKDFKQNFPERYDMSDEAWDLVSGLLSHPKRRLGQTADLEKLMSHPFFTLGHSKEDILSMNLDILREIKKAKEAHLAQYPDNNPPFVLTPEQTERVPVYPDEAYLIQLPAPWKPTLDTDDDLKWFHQREMNLCGIKQDGNGYQIDLMNVPTDDDSSYSSYYASSSDTSESMSDIQEAMSGSQLIFADNVGSIAFALPRLHPDSEHRGEHVHFELPTHTCFPGRLSDLSDDDTERGSVTRVRFQTLPTNGQTSIPQGSFRTTGGNCSASLPFPFTAAELNSLGIEASDSKEGEVIGLRRLCCLALVETPQPYWEDNILDLCVEQISSSASFIGYFDEDLGHSRRQIPMNRNDVYREPEQVNGLNPEKLDENVTYPLRTLRQVFTGSTITRIGSSHGTPHHSTELGNWTSFSESVVNVDTSIADTSFDFNNELLPCTDDQSKLLQYVKAGLEDLTNNTSMSRVGAHIFANLRRRVFKYDDPDTSSSDLWRRGVQSRSTGDSFTGTGQSLLSSDSLYSRRTMQSIAKPDTVLDEPSAKPSYSDNEESMMSIEKGSTIRVGSLPRQFTGFVETTSDPFASLKEQVIDALLHSTRIGPNLELFNLSGSENWHRPSISITTSAFPQGKTSSLRLQFQDPIDQDPHTTSSSHTSLTGSASLGTLTTPITDTAGTSTRDYTRSSVVNIICSHTMTQNNDDSTSITGVMDPLIDISTDSLIHQQTEVSVGVTISVSEELSEVTIREPPCISDPVRPRGLDVSTDATPNDEVRIDPNAIGPDDDFSLPPSEIRAGRRLSRFGDAYRRRSTSDIQTPAALIATSTQEQAHIVRSSLNLRETRLSIPLPRFTASIDEQPESTLSDDQVGVQGLGTVMLSTQYTPVMTLPLQQTARQTPIFRVGPVSAKTIAQPHTLPHSTELVTPRTGDGSTQGDNWSAQQLRNYGLSDHVEDQTQSDDANLYSPYDEQNSIPTTSLISDESIEHQMRLTLVPELDTSATTMLRSSSNEITAMPRPRIFTVARPSPQNIQPSSERSTIISPAYMHGGPQGFNASMSVESISLYSCDFQKLTHHNALQLRKDASSFITDSSCRASESVIPSRTESVPTRAHTIEFEDPPPLRQPQKSLSNGWSDVSDQESDTQRILTHHQIHAALDTSSASRLRINQVDTESAQQDDFTSAPMSSSQGKSSGSIHVHLDTSTMSLPIQAGRYAQIDAVHSFRSKSSVNDDGARHHRSHRSKTNTQLPGYSLTEPSNLSATTGSIGNMSTAKYPRVRRNRTSRTCISLSAFSEDYPESVTDSTGEKSSLAMSVSDPMRDNLMKEAIFDGIDFIATEDVAPAYFPIRRPRAITRQVSSSLKLTSHNSQPDDVGS
ncbi:Kinase, AGC NDR [Giardia muris]|uniref:non-specific serine/threonine protein kinase n=1 Tax=Giardia muris TaxID=5742 RepID=A0A4Z1T0K0_GIAMU|nr:Kinase, AGC NDR [Giardia muris]|eukprot:TNJ29228.1 Kinase, AGC NDR [Giardia muris]